MTITTIIVVLKLNKLLINSLFRESVLLLIMIINNEKKVNKMNGSQIKHKIGYTKNMYIKDDFLE